MQKATYGRMKIVKCISEVNDRNLDDPKYLDCSADVLNIMDMQCTNKKFCNIRIFNNDLIKKSTCHRELNMYMIADYECIKVVQQERSCQVSVSEEALHLSSNFQPPSGCGSKNQPWHLQATSGQLISVELITLGVAAGLGVAPANVQCREELGHVIDRKQPSNVPICTSEERFSEVHKSTTNELQLVLHQNQKKNFILKFYATGCADLKAASDAWMKREGDVTTMGCYATRHLWMIHCVNDRWTGVIGNCTQQLIESKKLEQLDQPTKEELKADYILNFVSITCIVAVGLILIICITIICYCRIKKFGAKKMAPYAYKASVNGMYTNTNINRATIKLPRVAPIINDANMMVGEVVPEEGRYFVLDREAIDAFQKS